jgi:flagellar basal body-associated protein FliL
MKLLNIILSVLILLLAVAAAVFSFFLCEKRDTMIDGWSKMAEAVTNSAASLDKGSGTEVAKELSAEALAHDKYDDLATKLPKLKEHADNVITERDAMATALRSIAETSEMDNLQGQDKFTSLAAYKSNVNAVVNKVKSNTQHQNRILQRFCTTAEKLDAGITIAGLKGSNYNSEFTKLDKKIDTIKDRVVDAGLQFKSIFATAGGSGKLDFSDRAYKSATGKVASAVRNLKNKYNQSKNELRSEGQKIVSLKNTIKSKEGLIRGLHKDSKKKELEIKRLRNIISGKEGRAIADPWENGSTEARRAAQGKIIKVDRKYGFVVIDIGTGTSVKQKIGKKMNYASLMIPVNSTMIVARNIESENGLFIGEIKLIKIHEDCTIANVISVTKGKGVAVGDTVFFSDAQIRAMKKK